MVSIVGAHYNTFWGAVKNNLKPPKNHSQTLDALGRPTVYMSIQFGRHM
jgi:hypothetical protein